MLLLQIVNKMLFNQQFVKAGLVSEELGRAFNKAFDLRQRADYREEIVIRREEVVPFLDWASDFVEAVRTLVDKK